MQQPISRQTAESGNHAPYNSKVATGVLSAAAAARRLPWGIAVSDHRPAARAPAQVLRIWLPLETSRCRRQTEQQARPAALCLAALVSAADRTVSKAGTAGAEALA